MVGFNMKYLKTYEDFKQQLYTVGDLVKLDTGDVAKISKINSKNSYLVSVMFNQQFSKEPIEVREQQIVDIVKGNSDPAIGTDMTINPSTNPSNDMAINGGYPDTPLSNPLNT